VVSPKAAILHLYYVSGDTHGILPCDGVTTVTTRKTERHLAAVEKVEREMRLQVSTSDHLKGIR
jgi:hypothetical protein